MSTQRPAFARRRACGLAAVVLWVLGTSSVQAKKEVIIDHESQTTSPAGTIDLYPDELLTILVKSKWASCYTYNLKRIEEKEGAKPQAKSAKLETVSLPVIHHSGVTAYEVSVEQRADPPAGIDCSQSRPDHTYRIPVETYD